MRVRSSLCALVALLCAALLLSGCRRQKNEPGQLRQPDEAAESTFYTDKGNLVIVDDEGYVPEEGDEAADESE